MRSESKETAGIGEQQLRLLCRNQVPALLVSLATGIMLVSFSFIQQSNIYAFIWLLILILLSGIHRLAVARIGPVGVSDEEGAFAHRIVKQHRWFNILSFLIGIVWGAAPFVMSLNGEGIDRLIVIVIMGGISIAALAAYLGSTVSLVSFLLPVYVLSATQLFLVSNDWSFLIMATVYFAVVVMISLHVQRHIHDALALKASNAELLAQNQQQEQQLIHQARHVKEFQALLDIAKIWYWEADEQLKLTKISAGFQSTTGFYIKALLGKSCADFLKISDVSAEGIQTFNSAMQQRKALTELEISLIRPDGMKVSIALNGEPRFVDNKFVGYQGTGRDISKHKSAIKKLEHIADHDSLTGLFNRRAFHRLLDELLKPTENSGVSFYLAYIDLNRLKITNDMAGHVNGDELLAELAEELQKSIGESSSLARIGGDEFALILHKPSLEEAVEVVQALIDTVKSFRYVQDESAFSVGVNIGLVPVLSAEISVTELLRYADHACFLAKEKGDLSYFIASAVTDGDLQYKKRSRSVQRMFDALDNDQLVLTFQPIESVHTGDVCFFEVLLSVKADGGGLVPAGESISNAERFGVMAQFDRWVIQEVFKGFAELQQQYPEVCVFINLSANHMDDDTLFAYICEQFARFSVPCENVCFEITETAVIKDTSKAIELVKRLKQEGCRFALDDFGTGLSSLSYLKDFPVDFVKMDGSFIRSLKDGAIDQAILKAVVELGETIGFQIIAESVEDKALIPILRKAGVTYVQGFGIGYPTALLSPPEKR